MHRICPVFTFHAKPKCKQHGHARSAITVSKKNKDNAVCLTRVYSASQSAGLASIIYMLLEIRPSVCLSVTLQYCVKSNQINQVYFRQHGP